MDATSSHAEDGADQSRRDEKKKDHSAHAATDVLVKSNHKPMKSHKAQEVEQSVQSQSAEQPFSLPNVTALLDTMRKRLEALNGPDLPRI